MIIRPWLRFVSLGSGIVLAAGGNVVAVQPESAPVLQPVPEADRVARWNQDLDALLKEFPAGHKNAFFRITQDSWNARAADIRAIIPEKSDQQLVVELKRLVALIGDGHSMISSDAQSAVPPSKPYLLGLAWLSDGVFLSAIPKQHEALLAQRLVRLGDTPLEKAIELVATLRAHDNEFGRRNHVVQDLRDAESLAALGIVPGADSALFTFADAAGAETTIRLFPLSMQPTPDAIAMRPDPAAVPISRQPRRAPYGFQVLPDLSSFYIWYDTCNDRGDKTVAQFSDEAIAALDGELTRKPSSVECVIVDFRRNGGGNSALLSPLIDHLARRDHLGKEHRLFALIGRNTFSSAMMNASRLRSVAGARLVGEPTGGTPNGYGEVRTFRLPNSQLIVQYSTKFFRFDAPGTDAVLPDIRIEPDSAAFFSVQDAVLDAAAHAPRHRPE
ncbi:MAG: hypothetical protein AB7G11_07865 [Phycisphaerales bacterium]